MPKSARAAMLAAASLARYPDPNGFDLKSALATRYGVPMNWITLGNGSNDILKSWRWRCWSRAPRPCTRSIPSPSTGWPPGARRATSVPAKDYGHDLDAMFDAIADDTRVVFIANPNNPTGTFVPGDRSLLSWSACRPPMATA